MKSTNNEIHQNGVVVPARPLPPPELLEDLNSLTGSAVADSINTEVEPKQPRVMTDKERKVLFKEQGERVLEASKVFKNKIEMALPLDHDKLLLSVKEVEGFEKYFICVPDSKYSYLVYHHIYNARKVDGRIYQIINENYELKNGFVQFIQKTIYFTPETEVEEMEKGLRWLGEFFVKAIDKGIVNYGIFKPASYVDVEEFETDSEGMLVKKEIRKRILFLWPLCVSFSSPNEMNEIMGEDGFKHEGEL